MEQIFDDVIFVHYGFVSLSPAEAEDPDLDASRRGQSNGLLGAAVPGALSLMTGTHTGDVPLRIEWHEMEPPIGVLWDDVVEVSVTIEDTAMRLAAFDDARQVRLPVIGPHRVRLCASGMDAAADEDVVEDDQPVADRYLLQLWPGPAAPDRIVRVGSSTAQYWHDHAVTISAMSDQQCDARQAASHVEPEYAEWTPALGRGLSDEQLLADIPLSLRAEMLAPLAGMACDFVDISDRAPIRSALKALRDHQPLPARMTTAADVMAQLAPHLNLPPPMPNVRWAFPDPRQIEAAVQAVFVAADPDSALNPAMLLDLVKIATGTPAEAIIRQICWDLGYD